MATPKVDQTRTLITYRIQKASDSTYKGDLRGVTNSPVVQMDINGGFSQLSLDLDHYPTELAWGDLVQLRASDGSVIGTWKFESKITENTDVKDAFTLALTPMVAELTTTDYNANFTASATQFNPARNPTDPQTWSTEAVQRTKHLTAASIAAVGTAYGYAFNNATAKSALDQHLLYGGPGWYWYCDDTAIRVANTPWFTHTLTKGREVTRVKLTEHIHDAFNVQEVIGGQPDGATIALTAIVTDTNPANPLSIPNLGRRVAPVYNDSSLLRQSDVNLVATNLLAMLERQFLEYEVDVQSYGTIIKPGHGVKLRLPNPDVSKGGYASVGPYLVTKVVWDPAAGTYGVTLSDVAQPISQRPQQNVKQYVASAMQNPTRTAVSPDGSTGYVGGGVTGGTAGGGGGQAAPPASASPGVPTGLFAATAIENVAAPENASITMSCSARPAAESIVTYQYRYRRTGTTDWSMVNGLATGVKVTGLLQGTSYDAQVQAINSGGAQSGFSASVTVTTAQATAPGGPTGLAVSAGLTSVLASWNLLAAADVDLYELWQFTGASVAASPPAGSVMAFSGSASIASIGSLTTGQVYTYWLRAHNASGLYSGWSGYVQATPRTAGSGDIGAGAVATTNIANLAVGTAQIAALAVTDAQVNDLGVAKLTAGTITAGVVVGGYFQSAATVDSTHAGWRADGTSIKLYDGSGTNYGAPSGAGVTTELKNDGSAFFKGTIAAASLLTGAITSSAASGVPTIPGNFTGFQLDPTNGLRFYNAGVLTSQFTATGVNVYNGTISGATVQTGTGIGTGVGGTGIILTSAGISEYSDFTTAKHSFYNWNGTAWIDAMDLYASGATGFPGTNSIVYANPRTGTSVMVSFLPYFNNAGSRPNGGAIELASIASAGYITSAGGTSTTTAAGLRFRPNGAVLTDSFMADGAFMTRTAGVRWYGSVGGLVGDAVSWPHRFVNGPSAVYTKSYDVSASVTTGITVNAISAYGYNWYVNCNGSGQFFFDWSTSGGS